jgi:hypothetical protein
VRLDHPHLRVSPDRRDELLRRATAERRGGGKLSEAISAVARARAVWNRMWTLGG